MSERTSDLDQGLERPADPADRMRAMHDERENIQARGGTVQRQQWLNIEGRWIIRSHYTMPDKEENNAMDC